MKTKQLLGLVLFMIFLFVSVIDFALFLRAGTLTTIQQLAWALDFTTKLNLISKLLILSMFGVIFLFPEDESWVRKFKPYLLFFKYPLVNTTDGAFILRILRYIDAKMAIKCLNCGYIDEGNLIYKIDENMTFSMGKTAPFKCVKCGSKRLVNVKSE